MMTASIIWAQVEAVASALVERSVLNASDVREICRSVVTDGRRISELSDEAMAKDQAEQEALMLNIEAGKVVFL